MTEDERIARLEELQWPPNDYPPIEWPPIKWGAWPTRDEWAKRRRTVPAYEQEGGGYFGYPREAYMVVKISEVLAPNEIAALLASLRKRWGDLGRELKRHGGIATFKAMAHQTEEWQAAADARLKRREINVAIKNIEAGWIPRASYGAEGLLEDLSRRHRAADDAKFSAWKRAIENAPIDDAAWEEELASRAQHRAKVETENNARRERAFREFRPELLDDKADRQAFQRYILDVSKVRAEKTAA
jgi:hypothetical protein